MKMSALSTSRDLFLVGCFGILIGFMEKAILVDHTFQAGALSHMDLGYNQAEKER